MPGPPVSVAVLPADRGRGIGTGLLRALLNKARERRISRLCLSVERDNPAAALYERLGFSPRSSKGDALTMVIEPHSVAGSTRKPGGRPLDRSARRSAD